MVERYAANRRAPHQNRYVTKTKEVKMTDRGKFNFLQNIISGALGAILAALVLWLGGTFDSQIKNHDRSLIVSDLLKDGTLINIMAQDGRFKGEKGEVGEVGQKGDKGEQGIKGPSLKLNVSKIANIKLHNTKNGHKEQILGIAENRFCFLVRARYEDLDMHREWAECWVEQRGNQWILTASTGPEADDADVDCSAQCVSW